MATIQEKILWKKALNLRCIELGDRCVQHARHMEKLGYAKLAEITTSYQRFASSQTEADNFEKFWIEFSKMAFSWGGPEFLGHYEHAPYVSPLLIELDRQRSQRLRGVSPRDTGNILDLTLEPTQHKIWTWRQELEQDNLKNVEASIFKKREYPIEKAHFGFNFDGYDFLEPCDRHQIAMELIHSKISSRGYEVLPAKADRSFRYFRKPLVGDWGMCIGYPVEGIEQGTEQIGKTTGCVNINFHIQNAKQKKIWDPMRCFSLKHTCGLGVFGVNLIDVYGYFDTLEDMAVVLMAHLDYLLPELDFYERIFTEAILENEPPI